MCSRNANASRSMLVMGIPLSDTPRKGDSPMSSAGAVDREGVFEKRCRAAVAEDAVALAKSSTFSDSSLFEESDTNLYRSFHLMVVLAYLLFYSLKLRFKLGVITTELLKSP